MVRRASLTVVLALGLVLTACGGDDAEPDTPASGSTSDTTSEVESETADAAAAPDAGAPDAAPGEFGSFTVEGTEFAVTGLNRCEPFSDEPGNIDLQALAAGAILNLPVNGDALDISVQGSAIEDAFGSISFAVGDAPAEFSVDGDRITGTAILEDALDSGETVDVAFDVQVPEEINEC